MEAGKKLQDGIQSLFSGAAIFKRLGEKQKELVECLVELYKILVYVVEGREVDQGKEE